MSNQNNRSSSGWWLLGAAVAGIAAGAAAYVNHRQSTQEEEISYGPAVGAAYASESENTWERPTPNATLNVTLNVTPNATPNATSNASQRSIKGRTLITASNGHECRKALEMIISGDIQMKNVFGINYANDLLYIASKNHCIVFQVKTMYDLEVPMEFKNFLSATAIIKTGLNPHIYTKNLDNIYELKLNSTLDIRHLMKIHRNIEYYNTNIESLSDQYLNLLINFEIDDSYQEFIEYEALKAIAAYDLFDYFHEADRYPNQDKRIQYANYLNKPCDIMIKNDKIINSSWQSAQIANNVGSILTDYIQENLLINLNEKTWKQNQQENNQSEQQLPSNNDPYSTPTLSNSLWPTNLLTECIQGRKVFIVSRTDDCRMALDHIIWNLAEYGVLGISCNRNTLIIASEEYCIVFNLQQMDIERMPKEFKSFLSNRAIIKVGFTPHECKTILYKLYKLDLNSTLDVTLLMKLYGNNDCDDKNITLLAGRYLNYNINVSDSDNIINNESLKAIVAFDLFVHFHTTIGNQSVDAKKTILYGKYLN